MNALERLAQAGTNSVGQYSFIDADTIRDPDGTSYRLQGYDAPEVAGFKGGEFKGGTAGAADATRTITNLAESQGFTNLVKSGQFDPNGREIVELHDENGRNFTTELLKSGALSAGEYTSQDDVDAINVAKVFGHQGEGADEFAIAATQVQDAIDEESIYNTQFKQAAINEAQYGANPEAFTSALEFRKNDRSIRNQSYNPLSDSWDQGWIGAKEGAFGFLELLGESTDSEWFTDIGEAGIARARSQQEEYGSVLTDWKDVNGIKSGVSFLANNAAMSLPYMITTAGAAAAGTLAAPFVGTAVAVGGAIAAPATIYAGQVWNEMEGEKSAGVALTAGLAQAALDRLGIGAITGKILPKNITGEAVKKIMKSTGVDEAAAGKILAQATKAELGGFLKESAKIASQQIASKKLGLELLKKTSTRFVAGAGGEAITEAGQEAIGYLAATEGSDKEFNWNELNERLIAATIAGGSLGGTFATPGGISSALAEYDAEARHLKADHNNESQSAVYAQQEKDALGYVPSINEHLANTHSSIATGGVGATIDERTAAYKAAQGDKSLFDRATETILNAPALWRGATRNIFSPDLQAQSRSARILADMFGGNLQRIFSGASFENAKAHKVAKYKNMVPIPQQLFNVFGQGKRLTEAKKNEISDTIYNTLQAAIDKDGNFDPNLVPKGEHRQTILNFQQQLETLGDQMYADQKKHNPKLGYIKNYLSKFKALNKVSVEGNQRKFASLLQKKHGYSAKEAADLVNAIIDNPNVNSVEDAFSVVKGGIVPSSHKARTLNLSEDPDFKEFMNADIFANISAAAKSAARYSAHREYIGENGAVVSKLLDDMQKEGVSQAEVDKVASQLQDYLDAESGNYKRPTSAAGRKAQTIQKHIMTLMTLSGLPLATISSLVEIMLVNKGLNKSQIFGDEGSLKTIGRQGGKELLTAMKDAKNFVTHRSQFEEDSAAQAKLRDLGFYDWDVGAATVTGVTEVNAKQQNRMKIFFEAIGLTQWTDYTRAVRASLAGDYLFDKADIVWNYQNGQGEYTREVQEAQESLRNLGVDVDQFAAVQTKLTAGLPVTPEEDAFYKDTIREATYNFVNEAIALPGAANRPLIYQDPRFALFTQFQGFIATFTANHIPKLWGEYVKRGTPAMKYNAFSVMAAMIMMGFVSQYMKDYIKYGDDEDDFERKTGLNPYLDKAGYIRRGVQSSGLLGSSERVLNFLDPVYQDNSSGVADWTFNSAVGESPALGWIERATGAAGALAEGDVGKATTQGLKVTPLFGPFSLINKNIGDVASYWNFNGE